MNEDDMILLQVKEQSIYVMLFILKKLQIVDKFFKRHDELGK